MTKSPNNLSCPAPHPSRSVPNILSASQLYGLQMPVMASYEEQILVIPRRLFEELGAFNGLNFEVDQWLPRLLSPEQNRFLPRSAAEADPAFKQIIPYVLIEHEGRVLHYVRGKGGGESRLHAKGSIGIGGHINDEDAAGDGMTAEAYERAVRRELDEELDINCDYKISAVALLNDDSNPVGQVHLGIVHLLRLEAPAVAANEEEIQEIVFLRKEELEERLERLETWSQICAGSLDRILASAAAQTSRAHTDESG